MIWTLYQEHKRDLYGKCKNVADGLMKASAQSQVTCWQNAGSAIGESGETEYRFNGFDPSHKHSCPKLLIIKKG